MPPWFLTHLTDLIRIVYCHACIRLLIKDFFVQVSTVPEWLVCYSACWCDVALDQLLIHRWWDLFLIKSSLIRVYWFYFILFFFKGADNEIHYEQERPRRPDKNIQSLCCATQLSKEELKLFYRAFKQVRSSFIIILWPMLIKCQVFIDMPN